MDREIYLKRPLLEDVVFEINNEKIKIACPSTSFIEIKRREKVTLTEVEEAFRKLKKAAKESGKLKLIGVRKFLPAVRSLYPSYCEQFEQEKQLFKKIYKIARLIEKDGIHMGCIDDEYLETVNNTKYEILKIHYRNTPTSHFLEYYYEIKELLKNKKWENPEIISISIPIA